GTTWSFSSPVATSPASSKQYRLTSAPAVASSTIGSAQAGTTITGAYNTQWQVTFAQTGNPTGLANDTGTNTIVTVDAAAKAEANLPFSKLVSPEQHASDHHPLAH